MAEFRGRVYKLAKDNLEGVKELKMFLCVGQSLTKAPKQPHSCKDNSDLPPDIREGKWKGDFISN